MLPPLPVREARFGNADIEQFIEVLQDQQRAKVDIVGPLADARYQDGHLLVQGVAPVLSDEGVTTVEGMYLPTRTADQQIGGLFGIPSRYVERMRQEQVGLLDQNINTWAADTDPTKNVLYRLMVGHIEFHPNANGIVRAVKSDRYAVKDNFDVALAVMDGMTAAGLDSTSFAGADITEDRLWLRISAPEIFVNAPDLLRGYRDPRTGTASREVGDVVHAGLVITNSETGLGSLRITPELTVLVCRNGLVMNKLAMSKIHLGSRMDEGALRWSQDTVNASNELVKLQTRDAISEFLHTDFLQRAVDQITEKAVKEVTDAQKTVEVVGKKLAYSDVEQAGILSRFIKGGQTTCGRIMQAVTSYAQDVSDITRANELQATGVEALEVAYAM